MYFYKVYYSRAMHVRLTSTTQNKRDQELLLHQNTLISKLRFLKIWFNFFFNKLKYYKNKRKKITGKKTRKLQSMPQIYKLMENKNDNGVIYPTYERRLKFEHIMTQITIFIVYIYKRSLKAQRQQSRILYHKQ